MKKIFLLSSSAILLFIIIFVGKRHIGNTAKTNNTKERLLITEEKLDYFLKLADTLRQKTNVPGVGIAIVSNKEIIYSGGVGYLNVQAKTPVTENSLFAIGSGTKLFTGVLAAKLVSKGKLEWKDRIIKHLPDFELGNDYVTKNANIQDAFTHFTGLGRHDSLWKNDRKLSQKQIYKSLKKLSFSSSFREQWEYNNLMYMVMGMLVEEVEQKDWRNMVNDEIFRPLGMNSSKTNYSDFMSSNEKATGYNYTSLNTRPHVDVDAIEGAGSISSTPKDMSKWLAMFVNEGSFEDKTIIEKEQYEYMTQPKSMSLTDSCTVRYYSIALSGNQTMGKKHLGISGAIDGFNSLMLIKPEDGFGIFLNVNNDFHDYKRLIEKYAVNIFVNDNYTRDYDEENRMEATISSNILLHKLNEIFVNEPYDKAIQKFEELKKRVYQFFYRRVS